MMSTHNIEAGNPDNATKLESSVSTHEIRQDVDPAFTRKLKWKLDLLVLPLISSVYFFASMVSHPLTGLCFSLDSMSTDN
jgi:hypothetical protein